MATELTVNSISVDDFRSNLLVLLEEVFRNVHGFVLDQGDSLFETLESITAEEASQPFASDLAPLVAQVNHVIFVMDSVLNFGQSGELDWAGSWKVSHVTDEEWAELIGHVHDRYNRVRTFVEEFNDWDSSYIGGAMALLTHCAYHLGQIREGLGVIRGN